MSARSSRFAATGAQDYRLPLGRNGLRSSQDSQGSALLKSVDREPTPVEGENVQYRQAFGEQEQRRWALLARSHKVHGLRNNGTGRVELPGEAGELFLYLPVGWILGGQIGDQRTCIEKERPQSRQFLSFSCRCQESVLSGNSKRPLT